MISQNKVNCIVEQSVMAHIMGLQIAIANFGGMLWQPLLYNMYQEGEYTPQSAEAPKSSMQFLCICSGDGKGDGMACLALSSHSL